MVPGTSAWQGIARCLLSADDSGQDTVVGGACD